jgi:hypothetical protein
VVPVVTVVLVEQVGAPPPSVKAEAAEVVELLTVVMVNKAEAAV